MEHLPAAAFTGHRPERFSFGYDEMQPLCEGIKAAILSQIILLYRNGVHHFYTGCAMGVDLWAGEIVLALQLHREFSEIKLVCCIPFEGHTSRWPAALQKRYAAMLEGCTESITLRPHYTRSCYFERNRYMVDNTDYLIAVYDMNSEKSSGTGYTVAYAQSKHRTVILIDPDTAMSKNISIMPTDN